MKLKKSISKVIFASSMAVLFVMNTVFAQSHTSDTRWYSMEEAQQLAIQHNKKILIFAEARWCVYCKKMDRDVFRDEEVAKAMNKYFYAVKLDIESDLVIRLNGNKMTEAQYAEKNGLSVPPVTLFLDQQGEIITSVKGFLPRNEFKKITEYVGSEAYRHTSIQNF